jgi:hypothetical protein
MRIVSLGPDNSPNAVMELKVQELEVDRPPKADEFALQLPAGTRVVLSDPNIRRSPMFQLKRPERVTPDDLPRLVEMCRERMTKRQVDTAVHPSGWLARNRWAVWTGALAIVAVGAVVGIRRWRRS